MDEQLVKRGLHSAASIPERLTSFHEAGIDQEVLASSLGVTKPTLQKWQKGDSMPKLESTESIEDIRYILANLVGRRLEIDRAADLVLWQQKGSTKRFLDLIIEDPKLAKKQIENLGRNT